jgi:hypothetical protein
MGLRAISFCESIVLDIFQVFFGGACDAITLLKLQRRGLGLAGNKQAPVADIRRLAEILLRAEQEECARGGSSVVSE